MKLSSFVPGLVGLLIIACGGSTPPPSDSPPPQSQASGPRPLRRPGQDPLVPAKKLAQKGDTAGAIAETRKVIDNEPSLAEAYLLLSSLCDLSGDDACAKSALEDGVEAAPKSGELRQARGMLKLEAGDAAGAVADLEAAKDLADKPSAELFADLAYAYIFAEQLDPALKAATEARSLDANSFSAAYVLGEVHLHRGDPASAAAAYRSASEIAPKELMPKRKLALALGSAGKLEESLALYDSLIAEIPGEAGLYAGAAAALAGLKRNKEALARIKKAVEIEPKSKRYLEMQLKLQRATGDKRGARKTQRQLKSL